MYRESERHRDLNIDVYRERERERPKHRCIVRARETETVCNDKSGERQLPAAALLAAAAPTAAGEGKPAFVVACLRVRHSRRELLVTATAEDPSDTCASL